MNESDFPKEIRLNDENELSDYSIFKFLRIEGNHGVYERKDYKIDIFGTHLINSYISTMMIFKGNSK